MNIRAKVFLDRMIAKPLAFLLNLIVWPIGQILHIDHDESPVKVKVIATSKYLGMGSILRATPLIKALKKKYPGAEYIFITTLKNKSLVENLGLFNKHYYIRDDSVFNLFTDIFGLVIKLWKAKIDLYFDLEVYSAFSSIIATIGLARNRYGFYITSTRFRRGLNTHLIYFNDHQHISKTYLQYAKICGIKDINYKIEKINIPEKSKKELDDWMKEKEVSIDYHYLVINVNASDLLLERRWPADYFIVLIDAIAMNWKYPIFLIGSREEYSYVNDIWNKLTIKAKNITHNIAGQTTLEATMLLVSNTELMVTNDSGLYHIAMSFNVPVISMWGPANPNQYADIDSDPAITFYSKDIYCSPCVHRTHVLPCKGNNICMKSIHPKTVYKKVCEILKIEFLTDIKEMDKIYPV